MASLTRDVSEDKRTGRVYTPDAIVQRVLEEAGYRGEAIAGARVLDPACGDGQFLAEIVRRVIDASSTDLEAALRRVHGWDIDAEAVRACRERLDALVAPRGLEVDWNVEVRNALQGADALAESFDLIVGNPPYVRIQHLDEAERAVIQSQYQFCQTGSTDLYIAFFELAMRLAAPGGTVAFITPNTYFHTATARALRDHLASTRAVRRIVNYGHRQVFEGATTYAAITVLGGDSARIVYTDASGETEIAREIDPERMVGQPVWRLDPEALELATREGFRPLRDIARVHVGLATLADKVFVGRVSPEEDDREVVRFSTAPYGEVQVERALLRPIVKGSRVKRGGPVFQEQYIVFPYKHIGGRAVPIPEDELATRFPLGYAYLQQARPDLDRRDNGKPNPHGWYAFGRSQALTTSFGPKIICPPMAKTPTFVVAEDPDLTVYAGYFIRYDGDLHALADQLNSERMTAWVRAGSRDYMGGWKGYSKTSFQDFPIDTEALR